MAGVRRVKGRLMHEIEGLSEEEVKLVADFAAFLREREQCLTTVEVLSNKELAETIRSSREAWLQGKRSEFIRLEELKLSSGQNV